jgi:hypothetical protein
MCRWHLGFSLVSPRSFITFFVISPTPKFSMPIHLLLFDLQLCIWEIFKAKFLECPKVSLIHWKFFFPSLKVE